MDARYRLGMLALVGFIATVWGANWAIERYGFVTVGFGLMAPAGVYFAGLAFVLRDLVRETLGRWWLVPAILLGALLSYFISPAFALASALAFLLSESADALVYEPLRKRGYTLAVIGSNIAGAVVDSALFLWLAFGSLDYVEGQVIGKLWMTVLAVGLLVGARRWRTA